MLITYRRASEFGSEEFPSRCKNGKVRIEHSLHLCSVTNNPIITLGKIKIYLTPSGLRVETILNMVETLSVNILIGSNLVDKYVTKIYPTERQLRPLLSRPITILSKKASERLFIATAKAQQEEERHAINNILESEIKPTFKLRVARQTPNKPNSMKSTSCKQRTKPYVP